MIRSHIMQTPSCEHHKVSQKKRKADNNDKMPMMIFRLFIFSSNTGHRTWLPNLSYGKTWAGVMFKPSVHFGGCPTHNR